MSRSEAGVRSAPARSYQSSPIGVPAHLGCVQGRGWATPQGLVTVRAVTCSIGMRTTPRPARRGRSGTPSSRLSSGWLGGRAHAGLREEWRLLRRRCLRLRGFRLSDLAITFLLTFCHVSSPCSAVPYEAAWMNFTCSGASPFGAVEMEAASLSTLQNCLALSSCRPPCRPRSASRRRVT